MSKIIEIKSCNDCQYCDHTGLLARTTHWYCSKTGKNIKRMKKYFSSFTVDYPEDIIKIPDWCPL